jgi:capsular exopolysaccharide synthesis family protein
MANENGFRPAGRISRGSAAFSPITLSATRAYSASVANPYHWEQVLRVLGKNRLFVVLLAVLITLLVLAYAYHLKDTYAPVARLQIDPPGSAIFSQRESDTGIENDQEYLETQSQILQSDELATRVIRSLRLDLNKEIVEANNLARFGSGATDITKAAKHETDEDTLEEQFRAADRTPLETIALRQFRNRLSVSIVRGSRLVEVSFASHDARLAQLVTNNLVSQFIDQHFKTRYTTTMQASDWLLGQLGDLRRHVEESNQAVVAYQKRHGLVEEDEKDGPTSQLVSGVSRQLAEAQADRIQAEAYVRMVEAGQAGSLPQLHLSTVYQNITSQFAEASAKLAQARAIYGEENNNYKKLLNEVNELAAQREAEMLRISDQVNTSFSAAKEREQLMDASVAHLKVQMGDVNEKMVRYRVLKDEARANADLYNTLLARLKEAGLYAGLKSSNIRVVDPASVLDKPTAPHRLLIVGMGSVLGIVFSVVLAFAREGMGNTIRTPDDVMEWTGLPSLAMVPLFGSNSFHADAERIAPSQEHLLGLQGGASGHCDGVPILVPLQGYGMESEAFREMRASVLYAREGKTPQTILVTSPAAKEGKSTVAINLAAALSLKGKTCLVDGDLRKPVISAIFECPTSTNWIYALTGTRALEQVLVTPKGQTNFSLLASSVRPANPGELIGSAKMAELMTELKSRFDYIVIDSAPSIPFSDARELSRLVDGVLLVGRCGLTTRRAITRCTEGLQEIGANILGVVVNGMDFSSADYRYYNFGHSSSKLQGYYPQEITLNVSEPPSPTNTKAKGAGAGD